MNELEREYQEKMRIAKRLHEKSTNTDSIIINNNEMHITCTPALAHEHNARSPAQNLQALARTQIRINESKPEKEPIIQKYKYNKRAYYEEKLIKTTWGARNPERIKEIQSKSYVRSMIRHHEKELREDDQRLHPEFIAGLFGRTLEELQ
jgi:hypothetical protein